MRTAVGATNFEYLIYRCERPNQMLGLPRCFTFGGLRVDAAVARELLRAVEPMAALEAERRYMEAQGEKQRAASVRARDRGSHVIGSSPDSPLERTGFEL
jgi:hypothetical protein